MNAPHMPPTAALADACVRANVTLRIAPQGTAPIVPQWKVSGRAVPVRHYGSVDVFLEALGHAGSGDVLVVDNEGRKDEGCIGDQVTLETKLAGLGGIVIWGLHRDTHDIRELGLPLFSIGCVPCGPTRVDPRAPDVFTSAHIGGCTVTRDDWVVGDSDGVIFIPLQKKDELFALAHSIWTTERTQVADALEGRGLREQFKFADFLTERAANPELTFRQHLRKLRQSIEE